MPRPSTPTERTFPSLAARKRSAAARREMEAAVLRGEATEYERRWNQYKARLARDDEHVAERAASRATDPEND